MAESEARSCTRSVGGMATNIAQNAYFSLLRWRRDATRDEAKNIAVLLFSEDGTMGGFKAAPASSVGKALKEQGILGELLTGLETQFSGEMKPTLGDVQRMHESLQDSLVMTEPKETAVPDEEKTLTALYRAYVSPVGGGGRAITKGIAKNRFISSLQARGVQYELEKRIETFAFDLALFDGGTRVVTDVLSFATPAHDWSPVEHDAGHFLYAKERVGLPAFAVVQPPTEISHPNAVTAHGRILGWLDEAKIPVIAPDTLRERGVPLPV
jgi:hypothetical protein